MTARIGVVTFPGSHDAADALRAIRLVGADAVPLAHDDRDLRGVDAVVLPGGASYGDAPRGGAIAALTPAVAAVADAARGGMPVLGIGNGFQVLCEAGLLPGALVENEGGTFLCRDERLLVESNDTVWTCDLAPGQEVTLVLRSGQGAYVADPATLAALEESHRVVARYVDNPNGSANDIAGITNETGTVVGIMAHPEQAVSDLTGPSTDGRPVFRSVLSFLAARA